MHDDPLQNAYAASDAAHDQAKRLDLRRRENRDMGVWAIGLICVIQGVGGLFYFGYLRDYPRLMSIGVISVLKAACVLLPLLLQFFGGIALLRMRRSALGWLIAAVVIRAFLLPAWLSAAQDMRALLPGVEAFALLVLTAACVFYWRRRALLE